MTADSNHPLNICLVTDVFPPASGGSGWSTYYLGKSLQERGHHVRVLQPIYSAEEPLTSNSRTSEYGGLPVEGVFVQPAPRPIEKLGLGKAWREREAAKRLTYGKIALSAALGAVDVLHAQHMVSAIAAEGLASFALWRGSITVSVATVRDYWPLCPTSTRLFPDRTGNKHECADCHNLTTYLRCATNGKSLFTYLPALARWLRTARAARALASCDAVIGVSRYVRAELARSRRVPTHKLTSIPNLVHLPSVDRALAGAWPLPDLSPDEPFLLFAGKLDYNKGAHLLPQAIARSDARLPVAIAGEGPMRARIEEEARSLGLDFRFYDWLDNDSVILLMRRARALLFPSAWAEPLSRVLLEGCAAGAAIVALDTGGTGDIISNMRSGWLANDWVSFSEGITVVGDSLTLNMRLRLGARARAESRFASERVSAQVEALYYRLLEARKS